MRHSYALSYLSFRITLAQMNETLERNDAEKWRKNGAVRQSLEEKAGTRLPTTSERSMLVLRKFVEIAKADGFRLMIVNISSWALLDFAATVDPSVVYHDLTPLLIEASRNRSLRFKYDNHYNPETHALIGRELTGILRPLAKEHTGASVPGRDRQ